MNLPLNLYQHTGTITNRSGSGPVDIDNLYAAAPPMAATSFLFQPDSREVLKITADGKIFWNGREVEGDDEFRAAMVDLRNQLRDAK